MECVMTTRKGGVALVREMSSFEPAQRARAAELLQGARSTIAKAWFRQLSPLPRLSGVHLDP